MTSSKWVIIALAAVLSPKAVAADDNSYLLRFAGNWKGGGKVSLSLLLSDFRVSCNFRSVNMQNSVRLSGLCRSGLLSFVSKSINTTLKYDERSDSYSGTYRVGSGPISILSGKRSGDALDLDATWPVLINGHTKAKIYIVNDERGHFSLTTVDPLGLSGHPMTTSDLSFTPE